MEVECVFLKQEIDWDFLQKRFPEIACELSYSFYEPLPLFLTCVGLENGKGPLGLIHSEDIEKEVSEWRESLSLENIDVLYVYGIGLGHYYKAVKSWLQEKKERVLVFFEEDLSVLESLFRLDVGSDILSNLQVQCYYVPNESALNQKIEECLHLFLSDRVEWSVLSSYLQARGEVLNSWRLKLLRRSASVHAAVGESLHYSRLMKNIALNLLQVPHSFHVNRLKGSFQGIPAIICGAGVSLSKEVSQLKEMEQKALVFACGSAITAFGHFGIRPHFSVAVDPNLEEYTRLKTSSSFETPLIYSSRIHQDVLPSTNMRMGYLCSATGGLFEEWMHQKLQIDSDPIGPELGDEALSVTTLAVALAKEMGCNPILFCGVDLSYGSLERYSVGVMESSRVFLDELSQIRKSSDQLLQRENGEGEFVHTLVKWVMEAACIGSYAKKNSDTLFFNVTKAGLPIENVSYLSLKEFSETYCFRDYDLRGQIQAESEMASLDHISSQSVQCGFQELVQSFERILPLFEEMIEEIEVKEKSMNDASVESCKMSLIEMDVKEEAAYQVCLHLAFSVYQRLLHWWYPSSKSLDSEEGRMLFLEKKKRLWKECKKIALDCLALLQKNSKS